jgi:hypothetical protein
MTDVSTLREMLGKKCMVRPVRARFVAVLMATVCVNGTRPVKAVLRGRKEA